MVNIHEYIFFSYNKMEACIIRMLEGNNWIEVRSDVV